MGISKGMGILKGNLSCGNFKGNGNIEGNCEGVGISKGMGTLKGILRCGIFKGNGDIEGKFEVREFQRELEY